MLGRKRGIQDETRLRYTCYIRLYPETRLRWRSQQLSRLDLYALYGPVAKYMLNAVRYRSHL